MTKGAAVGTIFATCLFFGGFVVGRFTAPPSTVAPSGADVADAGDGPDAGPAAPDLSGLVYLVAGSPEPGAIDERLVGWAVERDVASATVEWTESPLFVFGTAHESTLPDGRSLRILVERERDCDANRVVFTGVDGSVTRTLRVGAPVMLSQRLLDQSASPNLYFAFVLVPAHLDRDGTPTFPVRVRRVGGAPPDAGT